MKLIVATDETSVVVVDDLAPFIEDGTLNVRLDAVSRVLAAIRTGVTALTPTGATLRQTDPARQERVAQIIVAVADSAKKLADAAPPGDPDAQTVIDALAQLHLPAAS